MLKIEDIDSYSSARTVAHWAVHFPGIVGKALAEAEDDWGHVAVTWDDEAFTLVSKETSTATPFRVGLRISALELVVTDGGEDDIFALEGKTVAEAMTWLSAQIASRNGGEVPDDVAYPFEKMGEHSLADGGVFVAEPALASVEAWVAMAGTGLEGARSDLDDPSPVRVWPHHFDSGTIGVIDKEADPEVAKSVTFGLSFGDGGSAAPYAYVLPWPAPDPEVLGELEVGAWTTDGWVGGLLDTTTLSNDKAEVAAVLASFYAGANVAAREAIGAD